MPAPKPTTGDDLTTTTDTTPPEHDAAAAEATGGPYDLVRARLKDGSEATVHRVTAQKQGLKVLEDKRATDGFGYALPSKPRTDLAGKPATTKEN